ncbi:ABC transporter permease [Nakamurella endophytica]|uniref:Ribose ABC transporter permease n=1 Tax=Nakamurella endophytica TaxID=1748367 RepID=A0A917T906_9ACTN|nr:ABC transporter permease [Nakamurella endophytica]GGM14912.1 ribose ABC transporter permease [Nakamurella endophytica]
MATRPVRRRTVPDELGIFGVLVVVVAVLAFLSPAFRSIDNALILLLNGAVIAFLALGQTFVLLTGGIDLSTGANIAMSGVLVALYMRGGMPWWLAAIVAVLTGAALGVVNGSLIHFLNIPPFIATFGTMGVASSIPLIITGANSVTVVDPEYSFIGQGYIAGIPVPVVLLVIAVVVASLFLRRTRQGLWIYALGGNRAAARLAGVAVGRTTLLVYGISGACAGMGGVISTSRLMVGFPATGLANELFFSIAAAVVGGVSLFGGIGSVWGAMIGAVLIATVSNGLNVLNVSSYWQSLVIGLIILVGVAVDTYRRSVTRGVRRAARVGAGPTAPSTGTGSGAPPDAAPPSRSEPGPAAGTGVHPPATTPH